jgi:hypothetical protein
MERLSEADRMFIVATVRDVLATAAPEEVDIYAVTSDDILRHTTVRTTPEADSDAFFGGLELTLGEILTHALALIAVEFLKHGWTLTRESLVAYLKRRVVAAPTQPPKLAEAEATMLAALGSETEPAADAKADAEVEEPSKTRPVE